MDIDVLNLLFDDDEVEIQRIAILQRFEELRMHRRLLRDSSNTFTLGEQYFCRFYRMPPHRALQLVDLLANQLQRERTTGLPAHIQVLITLRFLAEGGYQRGVAQDMEHPVSQTTASRVINSVVLAIVNTLGPIYIKMPFTQEERQRIQEGFRETTRIPGILGLVDGFLVKMVRPTEHEEAFFNYREKHSMNVQIIVNSMGEILNLRICPGSNNDRHVWNFSQARIFLENLRLDAGVLENEGRYYILADSGYTPSPVLLTPILGAAEGSPAHTFTQEHVRTRCKVEQTIGRLVNRWRVINRGRKLQYTPGKVGRIISACAILHNFIIRNGEAYDLVNGAANGFNRLLPRVRDFPAGIAERQRIVDELFVD